MNIKKSLLAIALTLLTGCTGLKEFNEKLANINNKLGGTSQSTTNANEKKVINLIDTTKSKYGEFKKFELIQDKEGYWSFSFEYVNKTNTPHILELIWPFRGRGTPGTRWSGKWPSAHGPRDGCARRALSG